MELSNGVNHKKPVPSIDRIAVLEQDAPLLSLMTRIRDESTSHRDFCAAVDRIAQRLITLALNHVPVDSHTITTPTGATYPGVQYTKGVCGVSVLRAGASMEHALRNTWMGPLTFGHILIQRDERTSKAQLYYSKLPPHIKDDVVLLLEPMLATGGSVVKAVESLTGFGVPEESIVLVNVVASKKGLDVVSTRFPELKIVSAAVDSELTAENYISPGVGDFGDRYYGT
ncbi:uracil phosphoribosyltransferase [Aspergillus steynii IBT 23096]|uniref:uracil phosphoribosyltransferase n=1 Tax=Aspergillus steynii IBT 23096 TaxID=1392250 RepID=A0A2I2G8C8_9EURO|nr:uracil phosphoribosyltransferase [Aspergillus steynii IBT 23096]PLB49128.1 uracil phosphoribosyltransferase [Aspergillus steynii IBT 23096]